MSEIPPYTEWLKRENGFEMLELRGVMHRLRFSSTGSDYTPVMVEIDKGGQQLTALIDDDQIATLREFLASYEVTPE
jgi:hypothetical protein